MYERFTDRARQVVQLANQEAQRFNHEYIGTEHILLGLVKEGSGVAANVLKNLDVDLRKVRLEVEKLVPLGKLPQTPQAKKVIEHAIEEARNLNHNYVGTEHLLLGLLREQEGVAAQVLMNLGLELAVIREELLNVVPRGSATLPGSRATERPALSGSMGDLPAKEFPDGIRALLEDLEAGIDRSNREKETAVAEQDFERAAGARDRAEKLKKKRLGIIQEWRANHLPDPSWLSWNAGTVVALAQLIEEEQRWAELPVLADALEEAGCRDREVLDHCRAHREHDRGCCVVALLLGRG